MRNVVEKYMQKHEALVKAEILDKENSRQFIDYVIESLKNLGTEDERKKEAQEIIQRATEFMNDLLEIDPSLLEHFKGNEDEFFNLVAEADTSLGALYTMIVQDAINGTPFSKANLDRIKKDALTHFPKEKKKIDSFPKPEEKNTERVRMESYEYNFFQQLRNFELNKETDIEEYLSIVEKNLGFFINKHPDLRKLIVFFTKEVIEKFPKKLDYVITRLKEMKLGNYNLKFGNEVVGGIALYLLKQRNVDPEILKIIAEIVLTDFIDVTKMDPKTIAVCMNLFGKNNLSEQLNKIWEKTPKDSQDSVLYGSAINAAGNAGDGDLLCKIWKATPKDLLDEIQYSAAMNAAGKVGDAELLKEIWEKAPKDLLKAVEYGSAINAAGKVGDVELLRKIWEKAPKDLLDEIQYSAAINAAGNVGDAELLREIWEKAPKDSKNSYLYGSAMNAAGNIGDAELLREIWEKAPKDLLNEIQYSAAMNAAGKVGDAELLKEIWEKAPKNLLKAIEYGSAINAAGKVGDAELLKDMWEKAPKDLLKVVEYGSAINAAGNVGDAELLREIWEKAPKDSKNSYLYGSAMNVAGNVGDAKLLREIWEKAPKDSKNIYLYGSAMNAAGNVGDAELLREIWEKAPKDLLDEIQYSTAIMAAGKVNDNNFAETLWKEIKQKNFIDLVMVVSCIKSASFLKNSKLLREATDLAITHDLLRSMREIGKVVKGAAETKDADLFISMIDLMTKTNKWPDLPRPELLMFKKNAKMFGLFEAEQTISSYLK